MARHDKDNGLAFDPVIPTGTKSVADLKIGLLHSFTGDFTERKIFENSLRLLLELSCMGDVRRHGKLVELVVKNFTKAGLEHKSHAERFDAMVELLLESKAISDAHLQRMLSDQKQAIKDLNDPRKADQSIEKKKALAALSQQNSKLIALNALRTNLQPYIASISVLSTDVLYVYNKMRALPIEAFDFTWRDAAGEHRFDFDLDKLIADEARKPAEKAEFVISALTAFEKVHQDKIAEARDMGEERITYFKGFLSAIGVVDAELQENRICRWSDYVRGSGNVHFAEDLHSMWTLFFTVQGHLGGEFRAALLETVHDFCTSRDGPTLPHHRMLSAAFLVEECGPGTRLWVENFAQIAYPKAISAALRFAVTYHHSASCAPGEPESIIARRWRYPVPLPFFNWDRMCPKRAEFERCKADGGLRVVSKDVETIGKIVDSIERLPQFSAPLYLLTSAEKKALTQQTNRLNPLFRAALKAHYELKQKEEAERAKVYENYYCFFNRALPPLTPDHSPREHSGGASKAAMGDSDDGQRLSQSLHIQISRRRRADIYDSPPGSGSTSSASDDEAENQPPSHDCQFCRQMASHGLTLNTIKTVREKAEELSTVDDQVVLRRLIEDAIKPFRDAAAEVFDHLFFRQHKVEVLGIDNDAMLRFKKAYSLCTKEKDSHVSTAKEKIAVFGRTKGCSAPPAYISLIPRVTHGPG